MTSIFSTFLNPCMLNKYVQHGDFPKANFFLAKCLPDLTKILTGGYSVPGILFAFRQRLGRIQTMWPRTWLEKTHRDWTINSCGCVSSSLAWKCAGCDSYLIRAKSLSKGQLIFERTFWCLQFFQKANENKST